MKLAIALETKYSKNQILQGYLNIVYFGNGAYGIDAAANEYFGVPASALTLPEAAALAGVVNSPVYYDPLTQPDHVVARRNEVLDKMLQQGHITVAEHDSAVKAPIGLNVHPSSQGCFGALTAPYFCDYVQRLVLNDPAFGADETARKKLLYLGGLTIRTTLDPKLQKVAQDQVDASMTATDPLQRGSSLVSVQPGTGKVLTMAQNTVYNPAAAPGNYTGNFALPEKDANGQPLDGAGGFQIGSTMKPFIFAEWLNSGKSMAAQLDGSVRVYKAGYPWKNSCGATTGSYDPALGQTPLPNDDPNHYYRMSVLQGLYQSINTITFQSAAQLDFCNIQNMATAAGVANGHTNQLRPLEHRQPDRHPGRRSTIHGQRLRNVCRQGSALRSDRPGLGHRSARPELSRARLGLPASHRPCRRRRRHLRPEERADQRLRLQHPGQQKL
ncbi:penicillin-binding protein 1A [Arthrobacter sp. Hiyo6]|nr:penicillin-binding protein 1A [Arthrobacter sp. Hiyo6]